MYGQHIKNIISIRLKLNVPSYIQWIFGNNLCLVSLKRDCVSSKRNFETSSTSSLNFLIINTQHTKFDSPNSHKNSLCTISRNGMCPRPAVNSHQIIIHGVMTYLMKPSSSTPLAISVNMGISLCWHKRSDKIKKEYTL